MMTGQILSGVSPLIAAKYQIVVMTMLFGVAGLSSVLYLRLQKNEKGPQAGP
jgi:putative ABC transport system permease protein